jgi:rod shape-determining protein MreB
VAVDLGTANTVVYVRGEGVVVFEPSVVAVDDRSGEVHAVGEEAKRMIGRTPATIRALRPLRHGVIADFYLTERMLHYFMRRAIGGRLSRPRAIVCVPSGITELERRAVEEATIAAGARSAYLIEEPMAAAIGAGLPIAEPQGSMVCDIGGGTTEVAVISLGGIVVWESIRVGGYEMDEALVTHAKRAHALLIGQEAAEEAKIAIGAARGANGDSARTTVGGRDLTTRLLRRATLTSGEVLRALEGPVERIVEAVTTTLEQTPPELAADVYEYGIMLVGGGALLRDIDSRLRTETQLPVSVAESALTAVAIGAGRSLDEYETIALSERARRPRTGRRTFARPSHSR